MFTKNKNKTTQLKLYKANFIAFCFLQLLCSFCLGQNKKETQKKKDKKTQIKKNTKQTKTNEKNESNGKYFFAVWVRDTANRIYGDFFDKDGNQVRTGVSDPILVAAHQTGYEKHNMQAKTLANGNVVVVFTSDEPDWYYGYGVIVETLTHIQCNTDSPTKQPTNQPTTQQPTNKPITSNPTKQPTNVPTRPPIAPQSFVFFFGFVLYLCVHVCVCMCVAFVCCFWTLVWSFFLIL